MYKNLEIDNFRGLRKLKVPDVKPLTLIIGANNVGKSALLEAIFLNSGGPQPQLVLNLDAQRGRPGIRLDLLPGSDSPWSSLFTDFDTQHSIKVNAETDSGSLSMSVSVVRNPDELRKISGVQPDKPIGFTPQERQSTDMTNQPVRVLKIRYSTGRGEYEAFLVASPTGLRFDPPVSPFTPDFATIYQPPYVAGGAADDIQRFGQFQLQNRTELVLESLRAIEPRLRSLTVALAGPQPEIYGDVGLRNLLPLALMGDGTRRLLTLVLAMGTASQGVVLFDEIESGIHHTKLGDMWQAAFEASSVFGTQLVATTHSMECVRAFHAVAAAEGSRQAVLIRLERTNGLTRAVAYDSETLAAAIENNLEVR